MPNVNILIFPLYSHGKNDTTFGNGQILLYTASANESLLLIAERFATRINNIGNRKSIFRFNVNVHQNKIGNTGTVRT